MRDDKIYQMRNQEIQRFSAMARQILFIDTRQQAGEIVFSSPLNVLRGMFSPAWFKRRIDEEQIKLFQAHDDKVRAIKEKELSEAKKPKLSIVGANGTSHLSASHLSAVVFLLIEAMR